MVGSFEHGWGAGKSHVELAFGEEPKGFLGSFRTRLVAVEHQVHAVDTELLGEAGDLFALGVGHRVGHDAKGWNAEIVEADGIVEAFHDDEAVLLDEFAVAGFLQAAGLLAEEFDASMKTFWEAMFGGWFFSGAFGSRNLLVFLFFLFELHVASGPCKDFALLGEHGVEDAASKTPAAFVSSTVVGQVAVAPFGHRLRGKGGVAADVAGCGGVHVRDVADGFFINLVEFADSYFR